MKKKILAGIVVVVVAAVAFLVWYRSGIALL